MTSRKKSAAFILKCQHNMGSPGYVNYLFVCFLRFVYTERK